jgi:holo-[acyl-carrier protein] synthase
MKILGVGTDIVEVLRIKILIKNKSFIKRIFTKSEILNSKKTNSKANYFSKRFAAKEALMKAIGTGFTKGVNFKDICIVNNKLGKPNIKCNNKIKKLIISRFKIKNFNLFLSLSDEKNYSIAFVIIQQN